MVIPSTKSILHFFYLIGIYLIGIALKGVHGLLARVTIGPTTNNGTRPGTGEAVARWPENTPSAT